MLHLPTYLPPVTVWCCRDNTDEILTISHHLGLSSTALCEVTMSKSVLDVVLAFLFLSSSFPRSFYNSLQDGFARPEERDMYPTAGFIA